MSLSTVRGELRKKANPTKARLYQRFFKTGPGEYGEGDRFIGVTVPPLREMAKKHFDLPLSDVKRLLSSPVHEQRFLALAILVRRFERTGEKEQKQIYDLYVRNFQNINSWDLVDVSAPHIVGGYLLSRSKKPLYQWSVSSDLWTRRISILATLRFIKLDRFSDTLKIAGILLRDEEDLIHKAVGWMLREVGKRHVAIEEKFLRKHYHRMPRTMLRYAIERFPEKRRKAYLRGTV